MRQVDCHLSFWMHLVGFAEAAARHPPSSSATFQDLSHRISLFCSQKIDLSLVSFGLHSIVRREKSGKLAHLIYIDCYSLNSP